MKPKISPMNGKWLCWGFQTCGLGDTPAEAYAAWQYYVRQFQYEPNP